MTISIKHKFVNPKSDTADGTVTRASNWNDEHELTLAQNRVLGRISAANGPVEELTGDQIRGISDTTQAGVVVGVNTRTAPYTLVASDRGKIIEMNVAGANTVTIPNETGIGGVNFPIGTLINVVQFGTGQTTLLPAAGVTARSVTGGLTTSTRYGSLILYKRGSNDWFVIDQTSAYLDGRVDTLETIAGGLADVGTVATDIASVTTVAGSIGNVNIAAANVADIRNFADVYQGAKASNPTTRNDGSVLQTGDLYYNTVNDRMRVYETGTGWIDYEATAQAAATTATTQAGIATAQAGIATSAAATATTQASTATTQAGLAATARTAAETARDSAYVNANVYASTAAGLAATTSGQQFQVISGNEAIRYNNNAGTAVELGRYPLTSIVNEASEYGTIRERMLDQQRTALVQKPKAAVVILLGQSLNAPWDTIVRTRAAPGAKMLTGGSSMTQWQYNPLNAEHVGVWSDLASVVDYEERTAQTPGVGIINTLAGGTYSRVYLGNAALGARPLQALMAGGMLTNLWAMLQRLCEIARTDGYNPEVMFYTAHGEANAVTNTSEAAYYELGQDYYGRCQLYAAQAMRRPGYQAPIAFTYPLQNSQGSGDYDRNIKTAIKRLIADLPNAVEVGAIYQWPATSDRIHPTPASFVLRGEAVGRALRAFADDSTRAMAPRIIDVTLSGAEFVATFNKQVTRDTSMTAGTNLNASLQKDGFEWLDNGTGVAISALVYEGRRVRGTLASTPSGTLAQQTLRLAVQTTAATYLSGITNIPGCQVRSTEPGWIALNDPTVTNYDWAVPQTFTSVRALT